MRQFQRDIGRDIRICTRPIRSIRKQISVQVISLCDIVICNAAIPERYWKRYSDLYKANTEHQEANKRSSDSIEDSVVRQQNSAVGNLLRKRGNLGVVSLQQSLFGTPSSTGSHLSFAGGASTTSTSYTSVRGRAPPQMMSTINMEISEVQKCHD